MDDQMTVTADQLQEEARQLEDVVSLMLGHREETDPQVIWAKGQLRTKLEEWFETMLAEAGL